MAANTITNTKQINGSKVSLAYITLYCNGDQETATVIYDSSAYAGTDPLKNRIMRVWYANDAATTARIRLLWDASTDVLALCIPPQRDGCLDFKSIGGLSNTAGSGITGDILLTTTGLATGDSITLVLEVHRD